MPKVLCLAGLIVSGLLLLLFGLDLAIGIPFDKAYPPLNIALVVCALILGFMSWTTYREQV